MTSCPPVMEDNLLALAKGLSPIHTYKPYNGLFIAYICICTLCIARYIIFSSVISLTCIIMYGCQLVFRMLTRNPKF